MCNLQTLANPGQIGEGFKDRSRASSPMRIWPIVEVPAVPPELRELRVCTGRCGGKADCLDKPSN